ncbi:hypothetical protein [Haloarchaeobius sp. HRN-SO-5]|uniref:DUF7856 family protein n=1 Tax=Haloarchaeobius sp. HRN-SO-5 TaxID=3446118 RepID=UPI003EBF022D
MRVVVDGWTSDRRAVDLRGDRLAPETVVRAVRGADDADCTGSPALRVECPDPGPVHEYVGLVTPTASVRTRRALAAVARDRGYEAPNAADVERLERRLAAVEVGSGGVDRRTARRRVAEAGAREDELRERVAELRGAVNERRALDAPADDLMEELRATVGWGWPTNWPTSAAGRGPSWLAASTTSSPGRSRRSPGRLSRAMRRGRTRGTR